MKKTTSETKICNNPNCPHDGQPQPIEDFQKSALTASGRLNKCKACMRLKISEGHRKKKAKKAADQGQVAPMAAAPPIETTTPAPSNHQTIIIDFNGHQDLLDGLRRKADECLRTPENMLLFMCKQCVEDFNAMDRGT